MLQMGAIENEGTALFFAAKGGHLNVVKYFLEKAKASSPENPNVVLSVMK